MQDFAHSPWQCSQNILKKRENFGDERAIFALLVSPLVWL
jgi:hypothetical protein